MSGFISILHLDGAPLDRTLLGRMTDWLAWRGPDAQQVWSDGSVGFGHTLLQTTWESEFERQPFTLDERVWIVADARIDDRSTLAAKLGIAPLPTPPFAPATPVVTDVELILRAYLQWGEDCVRHLLGDFGFVIWDARHQRLFAARDHFGVKPVYYSQLGNCCLISNTLNCLRQHPQVSSRLNEAAIGDFLLFDTNYNLETTVFSDIQRLPAAHTLTLSAASGLQIQRYWTLTTPEPIRYRHPQEYLDRFRAKMGTAVADRLRMNQVASFLSGGLDSTTIAATALAVAAQRSQPLDLKAFSMVYDRLMPDRERHYSGLAADALGLEIDYLVADDYELYRDQQDPAFPMPEPENNPLQRLHWDRLQRVATHSRVVLCGQGGDEALLPMTVLEMFQTMPLADVVRDTVQTYFRHGMRPSWGSGLLAFLRRAPAAERNEYPDWLAPNFAQRLGLKDRWHQQMNATKTALSAPRSRAVERFDPNRWSPYLEASDPGHTGVPVEIGLPFLDLRLLNYLLALPPAPWCTNKMLLREAMKQILPEEVRLRPKSPLAGDPIMARGLQQIDRTSVEGMLPAIAEYVQIDRLLQPIDSSKIWEYWRQTVPISFAFWCDRQCERVRTTPNSLAIGRQDTS
jgi:asparagine synthase (glutamine-hydrolysing)